MFLHSWIRVGNVRRKVNPLDKSTVIVIPTRGMLHYTFVGALLQLRAPLNQPRQIVFGAGMEVADSYNGLVQLALEKYEPRYIMTLEDDNLPPPTAHLTLLGTIDGYAGISGLYHSKTEERAPLVFDHDMRMLDTTGEHGVKKVGGIPMGCALWKASIFRDIEPPWFETIDDEARRWTHDLVWCERLAKHGLEVAVNLDLKVGHLDVTSGVLY